MYYCLPILAGIDRQGVPHIYSYDSIGSYQEVKYDVSGSSRELIAPVVDTLLRGNNLCDKYQFLDSE